MKNQATKKMIAEIAVRYRLLDQRVNNTVQIYDTLMEQYMIMPALDIAKDRIMIRSFYPEEACMIGVIAGQACY